MKEILIERESLLNGTPLGKKPRPLISSLLMKSLKLDEINEVYKNALNENPIAFINKVLDQLELEVKIDEEDLKKLPNSGAFITVSNHPYGGIDGLLLLQTVAKVRPDYKLMANYLLQKIEPMSPHFLAVNPFDQAVSGKSSFSGMKSALAHLNAEAPLGIFPAGEVSTLYNGKLSDKPWNPSILKLIKKAQVPVVPIYFSGGNSALFHLLGKINPLLRTAKLPSELLNKKNKQIHIRIGKPISPKEQSEFEDHHALGRFLRAKTYALGTPLSVKRFFKNGLIQKPEAEPIAEAIKPELIADEISKLNEYHLFKSADYDVFCAPSDRIPNTMQEIGRLREITYREVGEGTNHAFDLDEFDLYYQHLIIWDSAAQKLVGGYRIGKGADIMKFLGKKGFYIQQLFRIKRSFNEILSQSLELGRSYIVQEYQRKPLPLFLLWKGIIVFLLKNPEYRYLTGPVSISNEYSKYSKGILIEFLKRNCFDEHLAKSIKSRKKFRPNLKAIDTEILLDSSKNDMAKLDKIIQEIEPLNLQLPVLFKKYIKQNAKVIGFNRDPKFNDALDGLMILDIYEIPTSTLSSLMKELQQEELTEALKSRNLL